MVNFMITFPSK